VIGRNKEPSKQNNTVTECRISHIIANVIFTLKIQSISMLFSKFHDFTVNFKDLVFLQIKRGCAPPAPPLDPRKPMGDTALGTILKIEIRDFQKQISN
jgi:hypothetical protein